MARALRVTPLLVLAAAVAFLAFPSPRAGLGAQATPERKVILIQGILSQGPGDCTKAIDPNKPVWWYCNWRDKIASALKNAGVDDIEDEDILGLSYWHDAQGSKGYDGGDFRWPVYSKGDTCAGIEGALQNMDRIFSRYPNAQFDIVGHSLGGFVALYFLAHASESQKSRIHAVVSVDGLVGVSSPVPDAALDDFRIIGFILPYLAPVLAALPPSISGFHCDTWTDDFTKPHVKTTNDLHATYHTLKTATRFVRQHAGKNGRVVHIICSGGCLAQLWPAVQPLVDDPWRITDVGPRNHLSVADHPKTLAAIVDAIGAPANAFKGWITGTWHGPDDWERDPGPFAVDDYAIMVEPVFVNCTAGREWQVRVIEPSGRVYFVGHAVGSQDEPWCTDYDELFLAEKAACFPGTWTKEVEMDGQTYSTTFDVGRAPPMEKASTDVGYGFNEDTGLLSEPTVQVAKPGRVYFVQRWRYWCGPHRVRYDFQFGGKTEETDEKVFNPFASLPFRMDPIPQTTHWGFTTERYPGLVWTSGWLDFTASDLAKYRGVWTVVTKIDGVPRATQGILVGR